MFEEGDEEKHFVSHKFMATILQCLCDYKEEFTFCPNEKKNMDIITYRHNLSWERLVFYGPISLFVPAVAGLTWLMR